MNRCPIISTPEFPVECIKQDCAIWDKSKQQCPIFSLLDHLEELWASLDNLARSINQAVLMKQTPAYEYKGVCPKCGGKIEYLEAYRKCTVCDYSDPYK